MVKFLILIMIAFPLFGAAQTRTISKKSFNFGNISISHEYMLKDGTDFVIIVFRDASYQHLIFLKSIIIPTQDSLGRTIDDLQWSIDNAKNKLSGRKGSFLISEDNRWVTIVSKSTAYSMMPFKTSKKVLMYLKEIYIENEKN